MQGTWRSACPSPLLMTDVTFIEDFFFYNSLRVSEDIRRDSIPHPEGGGYCSWIWLLISHPDAVGTRCP